MRHEVSTRELSEEECAVLRSQETGCWNTLPILLLPLVAAGFALLAVMFIVKIGTVLVGWVTGDDPYDMLNEIVAVVGSLVTMVVTYSITFGRSHGVRFSGFLLLLQTRP